MTADLVIDWLGGNCPVQAEGTINGQRFYFRARGEHWRLEVHPTATGQYLDWPHDGEAWHHEEEWGEGPFEAGWMPEEVAREMIAKAAQKYTSEPTSGPFIILPNENGTFSVKAQPHPGMRGFTMHVATFARRADAEAFVKGRNE